MRPRLVLLLICVLGALVSAAGVVVSDPAIARLGGTGAFAALTGYAAVVGRSLQPLVRNALLAGLAVLGLGFGVSALVSWLGSRGAVIGQFLYDAQPRQQVPFGELVAIAWRGLTAVAVPLLGYGCLTLAVAALPRRPRRVLLVAGPLAAAAAVARVLVQATHPPAPYFAWPTVGQAYAFTAGPLLVTFLVVAAATLATQRIRPVPLVAGLVLTAIAALPLLDLRHYALLIPLWDELPKDTLFENSLRAASGANLAVGQTTLAPVLLGLAQLAGALLLTTGIVRAGSGQPAAGGPGGDLGT